MLGTSFVKTRNCSERTISTTRFPKSFLSHLLRIATLLVLGITLTPNFAFATWQVTTSYSGSNMWNDSQGVSHTEAWLADGSNIGCTQGFGSREGSDISVTSTGAITKNFTWVANPRYIDVTALLNPDPYGFGDDPYHVVPWNPSNTYFYDADPPPNTVTIGESVSGGWSSNTAGTNTYPGQPRNTQLSGNVTSSIGGTYTSVASGQPGGSLSYSRKVNDVSAGGSFMRTATINVTCTVQNPGWSLVGVLSTSLGFSASVVPEQYDFEEIGRAGFPEAELRFAYIWKCTTGQLSDFPDLSRVYEHIEYSGDITPGIDDGHTTFSAKNPPFGNSGFNPLDPYTNASTGIDVSASSGGFVDAHSTTLSQRTIYTNDDGVVTRGATGSFTGAQEYRIAVPLFGLLGLIQQQSLLTKSGTSASASIVRTVTFTMPGANNPAGTFHLTVSKSGLSRIFSY